ncbi:MAG: transglutaminase family protein [Methanomassiliicoccales archaeon]
MVAKRLIILAAGVVVCVGILLLAGTLISALRSEVPGFNTADLKAPVVTYAAEIVPDPHTMVGYGPGFAPELNWTLSPIYVGYGGAVQLNITNVGGTYAYIYGYGLAWVGGDEYWRNCSAYLPAGSSASLGLLFFGAPATTGTHIYTILLKVQTEAVVGAWKDIGTMRTNAKDADVLADNGDIAYSYTHNIRTYYNKVNNLVSYAQAAEVVNAAQVSAPGMYSLEQVLDAYDWIATHISYVGDPSDVWQTPQTTLSLRGGDCEDHAILLASTIGGLGGNARINLIEGHAFATVFVGPASGMASITKSVRAHYGTEVSVLFLSDPTGLWMVVDTVGMPYGGGLPALTAPVSDWSSGEWGPTRGNFLYSLDATGRPVGWLSI